MKFFANAAGHMLDNGLRSYAMELGGGAVEVQCFVATGSIDEGGRLGWGLSHFLEHMLFQGSEGYPGTAVADTVAALGGSCNAYTWLDRTVYHMSMAAEHLETAVALLAAMVRHPALTAERFEAEKQVILRECDRGRDQVSGRLFEELAAGLFPDDPVRIPVIGYPELLRKVDRAVMLDYYERRYRPQRCFLVAVGAVESGQFNRLVERYFGDWERDGLDEPAVAPRRTAVTLPRERDFVFPDALERIAVGVRLPEISAPEFPACDVLFSALGAGSGGRLVRSLELKRRLAIDLRSFCFAVPGGGLGGVSGAAAPGRFAELLRSLHAELDSVASGALPEAEIEREKRQQYADRLRRLRDPGTVAADLGNAVFESGTPAFADIYNDRIAAVAPAEVRRAAGVLARELRLTVRQLTAPRRSRRRTAAAGAGDLTVMKSASGLRTVAVVDRRLPLVEFSLLLPLGALFEPAECAGASALAAALLTAGTRKRSESALLTRLDALGAEVNTTVGFNSGVVELSAPRRGFEAAFRLLMEILAGPRFDTVAFAREQQRMVELLRSRAMSAPQAAFDRGRALLFGADHPYGIGRSGTVESVTRLTPERVREFYFSRLVAGRAIAGFAGDCTPEEAAGWSGRLAAELAWGPDRVTAAPEPRFPDHLIRDCVPLEREQSVVMRLVPGAALGIAPDRLAMEVFAQAENGLSARLFKRVREDNALAYSVGMEMLGGFRRGCFAFHVATAPDGIARAEALIDEELQRLAGTGLDEAEFSMARSGARFNALRETESCHRRLGAALLNLHYGFEAAEADRTADKLNELSREEVNAAIAGYCRESGRGVLIRAGKLDVQDKGSRK